MRALICGAGIAGLSTAWWLDHIGWDVTVVERAASPRGGGYLIDFWDAGYDAAERMGLIDRLEGVAVDPDALMFVDADGREVSRLDYELLSAAQGGRVVTLSRGALEQVLREAVPPHVAVHHGMSVETVRDAGGGAEVTLTDGSSERFDLVVGADGIHSRVRELAFGPESRVLRDLGLHVATYPVHAPSLAARLDGRFALRTVPDRLVGCYPIDDRTVVAFFALRCPPSTDVRAEVARRAPGLGWVAGELAAAWPDAPILYEDRVAQILAPSLVMGRVVLVGDAAHAVSLLAGQGAAMAVADAHVLAVELAASADVAHGLAAYEARVQPVARRKQVGGRRTAAWFVPGSRVRIAARDRLLRLARVGSLSMLLRPRLTTGGTGLVPPPTPPHAAGGW